LEVSHFCVVDAAGKVVHIGQQHSEQFQFRQAWLLRRHRGAPSIRQLNHAAALWIVVQKGTTIPMV
jgi:hypothetical protein